MLYWLCRHRNPADGYILAVQTGRPYNALHSLPVCDAR